MSDDLRARLAALVSDWQANGGSRALGDPTDSVWYECAEQLLDALGEACEDCSGSGYTVQGWTDKSGEPEDQYGPCATCARAAAAHDAEVRASAAREAAERIAGAIEAEAAIGFPEIYVRKNDAARIARAEGDR